MPRTERVDQTDQPTTSDHGPAEAIVAKCQAQQVGEHPFFVALRKRPADLSAIWLLMANVHAGISDHFVHWLAALIERIDDVRIASLVAKQLNDELGNGHFQEIHSTMLVDFLAGLEPFRNGFDNATALHPGRRLCESMTVIFGNRDPYEGVGALIVSEVFASKMDCCVGDEIRRQNAIARAALRWLEVHETLEVDHAGDSSRLAELVPKQGSSLAAVWRGANAEADALWRFLDEVHAIAALAQRH